MRYYDYDSFKADTLTLVAQIRAYDPDALLPIARGGLTLSHAIAHALDIRAVLPINAILYEKEQKGDSCDVFNVPDLKEYERILILDDIVDSGETLKRVQECLFSRYSDKRFKTASLFYKRTAAVLPEFSVHEATQWIDFFWERDFLTK